MSSRFPRMLKPLEVESDPVAAVGPQAIIDIGSNSIRLVVWQDGGRVPPVMFNEKLMAGLGRGLRETGRMEDDVMAAGERALARFAGLARSIGVSRLRAVATAAVRQASNGPDFVDRVQSTQGLRTEALRGVAEAAAPAS